MDCLKAQSKITSFIDDQLTDEELVEFIEHIKNCKDCAEELEVYYTLLVGMKKLDYDENLSVDFHKDLDNKIKAHQNRIRKKSNFRIQMKILFGIIMSFALTLGIYKYDIYLQERTKKEQQQALNYTIKDYLGKYFFTKNVPYLENPNQLLYQLLNGEIKNNEE